VARITERLMLSPVGQLKLAKLCAPSLNAGLLGSKMWLLVTNKCLKLNACLLNWQ
jgi:hypothetical protein